MNRHIVFRHYWWIALGFWAAIIGALLASTTPNKISLIGSTTAVALGFCYFVQQQKLAETALFKDLFTEFNRRYDVLNDKLAGIAASGRLVDAAERQAIVDYFNLCGEEFLFFSEGYIHHAAWKSWCNGMVWYFDREPFRAVWAEESGTNSYYGLTLDIIRQSAA